MRLGIGLVAVLYFGAGFLTAATSRMAWGVFVTGLAFSIAVETPILALLLDRGHSLARRLAAGAWLSSCSYPLVVFTLPQLLPGGVRFVVGAELFAATLECAVFAYAFHRGRDTDGATRAVDYTVIVAANVVSFALGECLVPPWAR